MFALLRVECISCRLTDIANVVMNFLWRLFHYQLFTSVNNWSLIQCLPCFHTCWQNARDCQFVINLANRLVSINFNDLSLSSFPYLLVYRLFSVVFVTEFFCRFYRLLVISYMNKLHKYLLTTEKFLSHLIISQTTREYTWNVDILC